MENEAPQGEGVPTPVVQADTPAAAPEGGQPEAVQKPAQPQQPKDDEPRGVAKRLKELTDRVRAAEAREAQYLRIIEGKTAPAESKPSEPETEKGLADFGYDEKKYVAYLTERATKSAVEAARGEAAKWRQEQDAQSRRERFNERSAKFAETTTDFHEVFTPDVPVSEAMGEAIMDSDEGPAIAYYLGQNPDIAAKLSKLSAVQAGREIARLEDRIVAERKKAAEKSATKAPPPAPKIEGGDPGVKATSTSDPASDKLSDKEWFALADKERLKKRG